MKIETLTPAMIDQFPVYTKRWIDIGLSTAPIEFEKAKAAVIKAYAIVGLAAPKQFLVADSPVGAIKMVQELHPELSKKDIMHAMSFGNHEAPWLSFYEYFKEVVGIKECEKLDGIFELARVCGWTVMYDELVVFVQRPMLILFDDQKRLHSENGAAILYPDGFSVYSWHGVRIPKEWIENKASLTPSMALTWANVEQRRAACEIVGWKRILDDLSAKVINEDADPMIGTLLEVELPNLGTERFLKVLCGTGREFALPVPPTMKTALEANSWTFGIDNVNSFVIPEIRT